jgi:hypothetical protein
VGPPLPVLLGKFMDTANSEIDFHREHELPLCSRH